MEHIPPLYNQAARHDYGKLLNLAINFLYCSFLPPFLENGLYLNNSSTSLKCTAALYLPLYDSPNPFNTGRDDLIAWVTHIEAGFKMVIYTKFDVWHCEVRWTYVLTRLLWYVCNFVHWKLCITLHTVHPAAQIKLESKMVDILYCMLPSTAWSILQIALDCTLPASLTVWFQLLSKAHSRPAWVMLSSKLVRSCRVHFQVHLQVHSQVHTQECSQGLSQLYSLALSHPAWL